MLYYFFRYLEQHFEFSGQQLFQYISFRAAAAIILSLLISMVFGKRLIDFLRQKQIGETVRDLGLDGEAQKQGTPTMGGLIILGSILIPTILFSRIGNIYVVIMLIATIGLGSIGFLDDYIKVFKKNKQGLRGKFKVVGQIVIGSFVGLALLYSEFVVEQQSKDRTLAKSENIVGNIKRIDNTGKSTDYVRVKSLTTTIPFYKDNEFDYAILTTWMGNWAEPASKILYVIMVIFIVTAVSNGANITDGIDGLAAGTSAIIGITLAILAYVSGNFVLAEYLNIMHIPHLDELSIFIGAFVGACIGFLWYNTYPAQVFMGDTGSLALGGIIGCLAVIVRKELMLPVICGIFFVENLSVMIQVAYFKYTKKKFGEGRRIFKMSPLHHHYQKLGYNESKITTRFWIVGILLALVSLLSLKIR